MSAIGKVSAIFTASTSGLTAGVKAASSSVRSLKGDTAGLASSMRALVAINGAQLFGSIASSAASGVRGLLSFAQGQADIIDNASKLSARLGFTYSEFAGLSLAADLAGVSMEMIGKATQKSEIAFAKAASGSKTATAAFASLGLSVEQLNSMSAAERFGAITDAISALPTEAQRAAASVEIFGKAGAELLPLFSGGAGGIAAARAEADRLGLALSDVQGQTVEAMNDSFTMAGKAIAGVVQQVTAYLAPAVTAVANTFVAFVGNIGGANIGQAIGDGIIRGAVVLAGVADVAVAGLSSAFSYASSVNGEWSSTWSFISGIGTFLATVARLFQTGFLSVVRLLITPLSNILEQIFNLASFIPGMGDTASVMAAGVKGFRDGLDASIRSSALAANQNIDALTSSGKETGSAIATPISNALEAAIQKAKAAAASVDKGPGASNIGGPSAVSTAMQAAGKSIETGAKTLERVAATPLRLPQEAIDLVQGKWTPSTQAVRGIDARSSEGVAEFYRLVRGNRDDASERTAAASERTADATERMASNQPAVVEFS